MTNFAKLLAQDTPSLIYQYQVRARYILSLRGRRVPNNEIWANIHELREVHFENRVIYDELRRRGFRWYKIRRPKLPKILAPKKL